MRHAVGPAPKQRWWRYPLVGLLVAVAVTAGLVALEDSPEVEEAVATAQPTPQPTPTPLPQPTAMPDPTAAPTAAPTARPELEVANTESAEPVAPVANDYVPSFVVDVDRSPYDANVSAQLVAPTPTPAAPATVPVPTATPQPTPTAEAQPDQEKTKTNESDVADGTSDAGPNSDSNTDAGESGSDAADSEDDSEHTDGTDNGSSDGPTAAQWAALRNCESGGNYSIVSANGLYRGAYQFSQPTWDSTASWANPSLVGTDPAEASPAQQDAMALALYSSRGASPWPTCGRHLS